MSNQSNMYFMSHYASSHFNDSDINQENINQELNIDSFKQKFIFYPFQYQEALQQTLFHEIKSLNPIKVQNNQQQDQYNQQKYQASFNYHPQLALQATKNSKVYFDEINRMDSFNSTSKSIKTNKSLFRVETSSSGLNTKNRMSQANKSHKNLNNSINKSSLSKPPNLLTMKKNFSNMSISKVQMIDSEFNRCQKILKNVNQAIALNGRTIQKKTFFNKEKYEEDHKKNISKSSNTIKKSSNSYRKNLQLARHHLQAQNELSQRPSIAISSIMVQNVLKNTSQKEYFNGQNINNRSESYKSGAFLAEDLSFYSLCMLLFPQTPKSIPCPVFIIDTLFYQVANESKQTITYVFKDRKRNLLVKMKNKGKNAFELFLKRRVEYQHHKAKEDKLRKAGYFQNLAKKRCSVQTNQLIKNVESCQQNKVISSSNQNFSISINLLSGKRKMEPSVKCLQESCCELYKNEWINRNSIAEEQINFEEAFDENNQNIIQQTQEQVYKCAPQLKRTEEGELPQELSRLSSYKSIQNLKQKLSKLSFQNNYKTFITEKGLDNIEEQVRLSNPSHCQSPIITPSNSVRETHHSLQTNYMALLKYKNGHIIRLKCHEFKNIFQNPLYANQRFKNNNNTQYIQALPIEDEFKDLKVYSMHFHYELFKNEQLFLHAKNSLYKQNDYLTGGSKNYFQQFDKNHNSLLSKQKPSMENISIQRKNSLRLKKKLKEESIEVYLYYQIFQMYTYASMHYNKKIINGVFRFIEYENDFALFQTENVIVQEMSPDAQFIKAKIFKQDSCQNLQKQNNQISSLQKNRVMQQSKQGISQLRHQNNQPLSQTIKKISQEMLRLEMEPKQEQSAVQKAIFTYFSQQNVKIEKQMSNYFNDKIEKIKNIRDMDLSKNIFRVINGIQQKDLNQKQTKNTVKPQMQNILDIHQMLNDDKKLQKFLKTKWANDSYSRRDISNYSIVRWKKEVEKVKQRKNAMNREKQIYSSLAVKQLNNNNAIKSEKYKTRPKTAGSQEEAFPSPKWSSKSYQKNNYFGMIQTNATENKQSNFMFSQYQSSNRLKKNHPMDNQRPISSMSQKQFEKRLINEKYTQFNKNKFELNAFKASKFI